jgi:hypothetical protein
MHVLEWAVIFLGIASAIGHARSPETAWTSNSVYTLACYVKYLAVAVTSIGGVEMV